MALSLENVWFLSPTEGCLLILICYYCYEPNPTNPINIEPLKDQQAL